MLRLGWTKNEVSEAMDLAPGMAPESELSGGGEGSRDPLVPLWGEIL